MLALSFFATVFSSLVWLIYSIAYISDNIVGMKFSALGIVDIAIYIGLIIVPILTVWMIFGFVVYYISFRNIDRNLYVLFRQMKKNQDYTDLIARIMLESEQQIKDGFILNRIDILIADMNELIAEIITRAALASPEQIESLWNKVKNGGKWALGKVIIEISQNQPNFQMRIYEKSQKDMVLAGTVLEFCARYQNLLSLLEKHDKERVFLNVIETGIFGKVFSILAPINDEIRKNRDSILHFDEEENDNPLQVKPAYKQKAPKNVMPNFSKKEEPLKDKLKAGLSKWGIFGKNDKKAQEKNESVRDPFSIALEKSFGAEEPKDDVEPTSNYTDSNLNVSEEEIIKEENLVEPHFENHLREEDKIELNNRQKNEPFVDGEPYANLVQQEDNEVNSNKLEATPNLAMEDEKKQEVIITSTQKTLNELKKEWEDMRKVPQTNEQNSQSDDDNAKIEKDLAYPFGGWSDESNYK